MKTYIEKKNGFWYVKFSFKNQNFTVLPGMSLTECEDHRRKLERCFENYCEKIKRETLKEKDGKY